MRVDQGGHFSFTCWERRAAAPGIVINPTRVEIHNSLALGEQYHAPFRRFLHKFGTRKHPSHHIRRYGLRRESLMPQWVPMTWFILS